jgi:hypothetical protein
LMTRIIFGEEYGSLSSSLISFFTLLLLFPLRSEYSPQQPILKTPSPTLLPQCERTKFHAHTKQQAKLYFCISLYFWIENWVAFSDCS